MGRLGTNQIATASAVAALTTSLAATQAEVDAEETARAAAVAGEATSRAAAIAAEAASRATAITAEATSRTAAIAAEASARGTALTAEENARIAAINSEASARATAITNEAAARAVIADDVLSVSGRKLLRAPVALTGSGGADRYTPLSFPSSLTLTADDRYRINGTIQVRDADGDIVYTAQVRDMVLQRMAAISAWWSVAGYAQDAVVLYNPGGGQRMFRAIQATATTDVPVANGNAFWEDMGTTDMAPDFPWWEEIRPGDLTPNEGSSFTSFFSGPAFAPGIATNDSDENKLSLVARPINGVTVYVEFDGSIANLGAG